MRRNSAVETRKSNLSGAKVAILSGSLAITSIQTLSSQNRRAGLLRHGHGGFARGIEEGERNNFRGNGVAHGLDRHFNAEGCAWFGAFVADGSKRDHFFQSGRPRG